MIKHFVYIMIWTSSPSMHVLVCLWSAPLHVFQYLTCMFMACCLHVLVLRRMQFGNDKDFDKKVCEESDLNQRNTVKPM